MTQRVYATAAEYYTVAGLDDPNIDGQGGPVEPPVVDKALNAQLVDASEEIDTLLLGALYDVDDSGFPTDTDVVETLMRATCAIVKYWSITEDDTGAEGNAGAVKIGSVSLGTTLARQPMSDKTEDRIGVRAGRILRNQPKLFGQVRY
ncbi:hypothetical protein BH09ACT9_BH09ACT9_00680 [soil metagenome]